jgi:hypothetical protein
MPQASETSQITASSSAGEPPTQAGTDTAADPAGWIIGGDGETEPPPGAPPQPRSG